LTDRARSPFKCFKCLPHTDTHAHCQTFLLIRIFGRFYLFFFSLLHATAVVLLVLATPAARHFSFHVKRKMCAMKQHRSRCVVHDHMMCYEYSQTCTHAHTHSHTQTTHTSMCLLKRVLNAHPACTRSTKHIIAKLSRGHTGIISIMAFRHRKTRIWVCFVDISPKI